MPTINFVKPRASISVEVGDNLMDALLKGGMPVASSCRGDGVCAKCKITVIEGAKNLSAPNDTEKFLKGRHGLEKEQRISCQVVVQGDVTVDTSYW